MFAIKPVTITGVLLTTVLVVSSANGQGFGGLIDKAKAKAAQVTANRATGSVGLVGLDDSGHPHTIHPEDASTPAKERALVQAIINDPKPGVNEAHDGEEYKKIKAEFGFSPIYTADDGFFTKVPNFKTGRIITSGGSITLARNYGFRRSLLQARGCVRRCRRSNRSISLARVKR